MQELTDLTAAEVKAFRTSLKLSQVGFAELLQVSRPGVEKWEKQGAPGYWRYVFAAINAGLEPWKPKAVAVWTIEKLANEWIATRHDLIDGGETGDTWPSFQAALSWLEKNRNVKTENGKDWTEYA